MQLESDTSNMNHISMLQKCSPEQKQQLYHPYPLEMENHQVPSDLISIDSSALFDDIDSVPIFQCDNHAWLSYI